MTILLTGGKGMLGRTLARRLAGREVAAPGRGELDVGDARACDAAIAALRPRTVLHCAAMTAVDRCETELDAAYRANAVGSANVAAACHRHGARLVAVSTDYVFGGDLDRPYHEWDPVGPRTVYGASKCAGEAAVRSHCPAHLIVRVGWLYGPGGPSFVHTMRRLARQGQPLRVVSDQVGNPTSTDAVADALIPLIDEPVCGTLHLTCAGEASWHEFAQAIFALGGLDQRVAPCATAEFPRPAPRPLNSRLDKLGLRLLGRPPMQQWRDALQRFIREFPDG